MVISHPTLAVNRRTLLTTSGLTGAALLGGVGLAPSAQAASVAWSNPVRGKAPTTYSGHLGWDVGAPIRTPVYAAADGTVVGVWLKHPDGRYSYYGHLTVAAVSKGQVVSRGQYLGSVGDTGNAYGYHLHFEIHWGYQVSQKIDAKAFLAGKGITLASSTPVGSTGYPSLKQGSGGSKVKVVQRLVAGEGLSVAADGNFGPVFTSQVKTVQKRKGLYGDGVVGNITWAALIRRLVKGSGGGKVGALQQALNLNGATLLIDNDFGSVTATALKSFQKKKGLVADAICGPLTWSALV